MEAIHREVDEVYQQITTWQKNILEVPWKANISKEVIGEITHLIKLFNTKARMESITIPLVVIFLPLMPLKSSAKSKNGDHIIYLKKRMSLWKEE